MNYGLYLSASGVLTSMHRQDVVANNLANLGTVGFKPDAVTLMSRLPERLEGGPLGALAALGFGEPADPQWLLEQLGGGQFIAPSRVELRQGVLQRTGNDLDLAIEGDGFFVVQTRNANADGSGNGQTDTIRLTRDGRFTLNAAGELVMSASGHRALDAENRPITLDRRAPVTIDERGRIRQNGEVVAAMQIVAVADPASLAKDGDNLLRATGARTPASGTVRQHHLETSAVDPVLALNSLIAASRAVQANATMMQHHNTILGQAINTFGRVA